MPCQVKAGIISNVLSCLKGAFKGNDMKQITIDGNNFSDEEEFYAEIDRLLTKDLDWKHAIPPMPLW